MTGRRGIGWALAACLAVGLTLAGCSGPASGAGAPAAPAPADGPEYTSPDLGGSDDGRLIARTASVTVVVDDIRAAVGSLEDVAGGLGGWVTSESMSLQDGDSANDYASVQLSVPSATLDQALDQIEAIGTMTQRRIAAEDVTQQVVDTDSRIATMRASIARLQDLIAQSGSVTEIAAVEQQLTQREADLESLLATQKVLSQRVETASIDVSLYTPTSSPPPPGFVSALKAGWHGLVVAVRYLLVTLGALLPWAVVAAVIVVPILLVRRRRRARRAQAQAGPPGPPPPARPAPAVAFPAPLTSSPAQSPQAESGPTGSATPSPQSAPGPADSTSPAQTTDIQTTDIQTTDVQTTEVQSD